MTTTTNHLVRAGQAVGQRWAALLGLVLGLLSVDGLQNGADLAMALAMAALGYLLVAVIGRPAITWPLVIVLVGAVVALRVVDVDPVPVFVSAAAVVAVVALASGRFRSDLLAQMQAPAAWLFGGIALTATLVSVELGSVLVAGGLVAHAAWDAVLWRSRRPVVSRSFVEWCAVFDVVVAVGIVVAIS